MDEKSRFHYDLILNTDAALRMDAGSLMTVPEKCKRLQVVGAITFIKPSDESKWGSERASDLIVPANVVDFHSHLLPSAATSSYSS